MVLIGHNVLALIVTLHDFKYDKGKGKVHPRTGHEGPEG
jgi:hypothetical protein